MELPDGRDDLRRETPNWDVGDLSGVFTGNRVFPRVEPAGKDKEGPTLGPHSPSSQCHHSSLKETLSEEDGTNRESSTSTPIKKRELKRFLGSH